LAPPGQARPQGRDGGTLNHTWSRLPASWQNRLQWAGQVGYAAWGLFARLELTNHAAALSFYFLLSAVPVALLILYVSGQLLDLPELSEALTLVLAGINHQLNLTHLRAMGLLPEEAKIAAGGVSLVTLLLASRGLFNALQSAFRVIYSEARRKIWASWLISLLVLPLTLLLLGLVALARSVLDFLASLDMLGPPWLLALDALGAGFSLLLIWLLLFLAYAKLPRPAPPARLAAITAGLAVLSMALLQFALGHFVKIGSYQALYGALGATVFLLIWVYFLCLTFLFWAAWQYVAERIDTLALEKLILASDDDQNEGADTHPGKPRRAERLLFGQFGRLTRKFGERRAAGEAIIREGETDRIAYYLLSGRAGIYKGIEGERKRLGELGPGALFGEMAYILNEPRSADVQAETDCALLALAPATLEQLMNTSAPFSRRVVGQLAARLGTMNRQAARHIDGSGQRV
jgi:membrane protein